MTRTMHTLTAWLLWLFTAGGLWGLIAWVAQE